MCFCCGASRVMWTAGGFPNMDEKPWFRRMLDDLGGVAVLYAYHPAFAYDPSSLMCRFPASSGLFTNVCRYFGGGLFALFCESGWATCASATALVITAECDGDGRCLASLSVGYCAAHNFRICHGKLEMWVPQWDCDKSL